MRTADPGWPKPSYGTRPQAGTCEGRLQGSAHGTWLRQNAFAFENDASRGAEKLKSKIVDERPDALSFIAHTFVIRITQPQQPANRIHVGKTVGRGKKSRV